jgi:hypothetical protein
MMPNGSHLLTHHTGWAFRGAVPMRTATHGAVNRRNTEPLAGSIGTITGLLEPPG